MCAAPVTIKSFKPFLAEITETENMVKEKVLVKLFYKVWSGFTKFIRSQVLQNRCAYSPFIGKFLQLEQADGRPKFAFIPC